MSEHGWVEQYWSQGFALVPGVFSAEEMRELGGYFDELLRTGSAFAQTTRQGLAEFRVIPIGGKPTLKFAKWAASVHPGLDRFRSSPRLLSLATRLLGPDLRQITNQMHWKNPGDGVSFQMHQDCAFRKPDAAYRDLYHSFLQTAIAVDESSEENGCLQLVPGSHREAKPLMQGGYEAWEADDPNRKTLERFPPAMNGLMLPGDVLIWNPYTIHGSKPNRSLRSRRVYINGFARTANCDHGVLAAEAGQAVPLRWGPETRWDVVEER